MARRWAIATLFWHHRRERWHRFQIYIGKFVPGQEMRAFPEERPRWLCL